MEELSLSDLLAPLKAYWSLIAIITIVLTVLAVLHGYFMVPTTWQTETSIVFEEAAGGSSELLRHLTVMPGLGRSAARGEFLEVLLNSRSVRGRVVDEMNLVERFEADSRHEALDILAEQYSSSLPVAQVLVLRTTWSGPTRATLSAGAGEAPELVAEVASRLIASLEQEVSQSDYTEAAQRRIMLEEQLQRATQELMAAEDELVRFATTEGLVSVSGQTSAIISQLEDLQRREAELDASLDGARAREAAARAKLSEQEQMAVSSLTESRDPAIDRLRQRIMDLEQQVTEQREVQGKSEEHPDVASLISELESARTQLTEVVEDEMHLQSRSVAVDPSYSTLVAEALTNSQRVQEIRASMDGVRDRKREVLAELERLPARSRTYEGLRREVEMRGEAVARLTESYDMARIGEAASTTTFSVIDDPIIPEKPAGPSLKRAGGMAFGASLLLSMLLAYAMYGRRASATEETRTTDEVA